MDDPLTNLVLSVIADLGGDVIHPLTNLVLCDVIPDPGSDDLDRHFVLVDVDGRVLVR